MSQGKCQDPSRSSTGKLRKVGQTLSSKLLKRQRKHAFGKVSSRTLRLELLDSRIVMASDASIDISEPNNFPIAVSRWLEAHDELGASLSDEELFDTLARDALNGVAQRSSDLVHALGHLPGFGDEIATAAAPLVQAALQNAMPATELRGYLERNGFQVDRIASAEQLLNGETEDLLVLSYRGRIDLAPTVTQVAGEMGLPTGVNLNVSGSLEFDAETQFEITFGVHLGKGVFIQEGSTISSLLSADGQLVGVANVPRLPSLSAQISSGENGNLFNTQATLLVSDFDSTANERFYITEVGQNLHEVIANGNGVTISGAANLETRLTIDDPASLLPQFIRSHARDALPASLTWPSEFAINLDTQEVTYSIDTEEISAVAALLGEDGRLDESIFQYLRNVVSAHNPVPETVLNLLSTRLPLIGSTLLDVLNVPNEMRFLLSPETFSRENSSGIQQAPSGSNLDFKFDLLSPANLVRMLKGEAFDIFSADINQSLRQNVSTITVLPETTVFSYLGIANVTMQVNLIPDLYLNFDFTVGLDSQGFYLQGNRPGAGGRSQIEFGGGITGEIIAEGDVLSVLDLARVTAGVGVEAFGGFNFMSPHLSDSKMRIADLTDQNVGVSAGIDLNLKLKGEVGLLDFNIKREARAEQSIEIYRSEAGTLSDIRQRLSSFKDQYQREARQAVLIGAAMGIPECMFVATTMLYKEMGSQLAPTARALYEQVTQNLGLIAKSLRQVLNAGVVDIAKVLHSQLGGRLGDVVKVLRNELRVGLGEIAVTLKNELGVNLGTIAKTLRTELNASVGEIAKVLKSDLNASILDVARTIRTDLAASLPEVASVLRNDLRVDITDIAVTLRALGASISDIANILGRDLRVSLTSIAQSLSALTGDVSSIASAMFGTVTTNLGALAESIDAVAGTGVAQVAQALGAVSRDVGAIANALRDKVTTNLNSIAAGMWSISWTSPADVARGLGTVSRDAGAIASALRSHVSGSLNSIASAMWSISWTSTNDVARGLGTVSRDVGAIASALRANVTSNLSSIASSMWAISWTSANDVARGLGAVSRDAGAIASALRSQVTSSLNSIASAMWSISWTSINDVARGLGNVSRDAGAIASALRSNVSGNLDSIASAMYRAISWTSYSDVANGLKSVTSDANRIAGALRNGAGASVSQVRNALQSVGSGLSNLQSALANVGSGFSGAVNRVGGEVARIVGL